MRYVNISRNIAQITTTAGVADQAAETTVWQIFWHRCYVNLDAMGLGAGAQHANCLRMRVGVDDKSSAVAFIGTKSHGHCFGGGGGLVKQRPIGNIETGQISHHCLKIQHRF